MTWSMLAMAMVPAVVSAPLGYLPETLSGGSRNHKATLIRRYREGEQPTEQQSPLAAVTGQIPKLTVCGCPPVDICPHSARVSSITCSNRFDTKRVPAAAGEDGSDKCDVLRMFTVIPVMRS